MIAKEPIIQVGIVEARTEIHGSCSGRGTVNGTEQIVGEFSVSIKGQMLELSHGQGRIITGGELRIVSEEGRFSLRDVTIGVQFHWERTEEQTFHGVLRLIRDGKGITAINEVGLEEYLKSVISSEMSAESPSELLEAHAITSRSWLVAMLERQHEFRNVANARRSNESPGELIRWYDREDHPNFNVCADDHCQRYQGILKIISGGAGRAVDATRGLCLMHGNEICDARFSKACGGITEDFQSAWDDIPVSYLSSITDSEEQVTPLKVEKDVQAWVMSRPKAFCNVTDAGILKTILPSFDRETDDFFRWQVSYGQSELSDLIRKKSGLDFGSILDLIPVQRGASGRIIRLRIVGSRKTLIVGKELEIRKWLSSSHLYSSAFVVTKLPAGGSVPESFTLHGAGWGHGVGLCQIGAAAMATKGMKAEQILTHYFTGTKLKKLY